jgi:hypothetical protein
LLVSSFFEGFEVSAFHDRTIVASSARMSSNAPIDGALERMENERMEVMVTVRSASNRWRKAE